MKKLFIYGACALFSVAAVSCHGDDPLGPSGPSVITKTTNSISGVIYDQNGNPVEGAVVTCGDKTTTTNAQGEYRFDDVEPGEHEITVTKDGKTSDSRDVTINSSSNAQQGTASFVLYPASTSTKLTIKPSDTNTQETDVTSDFSTGNNKAATTITAEVEPGTVDEEVEVWITPIYSSLSSEVMGSKAAEECFLLGATVHSSKPVTLKKDIKVTFDIDDSMTAVTTVKKNDNGNWKDQTAQNDGDKIVVSTREFTSFGLFAPIEITRTNKTRALTFTPSSWDNLTGSSPMIIGASSYNYTSGLSIETTATTQLQALMKEYLFRTFGFGTKTLTANYNIDSMLPAGYAASINGLQHYYELNAVCGSRSVKATQWGTAEIWVKQWTNDHNGGGSL